MVCKPRALLHLFQSCPSRCLGVAGAAAVPPGEGLRVLTGGFTGKGLVSPAGLDTASDAGGSTRTTQSSAAAGLRGAVLESGCCSHFSTLWRELRSPTTGPITTRKAGCYHACRALSGTQSDSARVTWRAATLTNPNLRTLLVGLSYRSLRAGHSCEASSFKRSQRVVATVSVATARS
jgi:hypothetical protein